MQHLNIHSIIDESSSFNSENKEDNSEKNRIALLKSANVDEIHLFKISGKSTQEQLSSLKDNLGWRIQTSVNLQEKTFLKAFYSIVSHALLMKKDDKDITHINLPFLKEELLHLNYRDLAILNEIDLFNTRTLHQEPLNEAKYQKLIKCLHLSFYLGKKLFFASKKGLGKLRLFIVKLKKIKSPK